LIDYEDFLRTNKLKLLEKEHKLTVRFRELNKTPNANYLTYIKAIENPEPEICANSMICLIKNCNMAFEPANKVIGESFH